VYSVFSSFNTEHTEHLSELCVEAFLSTEDAKAKPPFGPVSARAKARRLVSNPYEASTHTYYSPAEFNPSLSVARVQCPGLGVAPRPVGASADPSLCSGQALKVGAAS